MNGYVSGTRVCANPDCRRLIRQAGPQGRGRPRTYCSPNCMYAVGYQAKLSKLAEQRQARKAMQVASASQG